MKRRAFITAAPSVTFIPYITLCLDAGSAGAGPGNLMQARNGGGEALLPGARRPARDVDSAVSREGRSRPAAAASPVRRSAPARA